MSHDVFVSYSTKNKGVAEAVCKSLEKDGIQCWIAPRDVLPGVEYADAIIEALNTCRVFLVILSEESNSSPQVRREVERAVSKDLDILTFRIDNTILSKAMEYYLSNRHWLDASNAVFSKQLHSLSEAVRKLLGQPSPPKEEAVISEPIEIHELPKPVSPAEEVPRGEVPPPIPTKPQEKRRFGWIWAPVIIFILAAVSYFGWLMKDDLPFFSLATATNTPRPTPTRNYAATAQARSAILTAVAQDAWVHGFVEPILSQIANRPPDFQDDFSDLNWSYSHWNFFEGVILGNGQAVITNTNEWHGMGLTMYTSDFVFKFKFTPTNLDSQSFLLGFSFRADAAGQVYNHFSIGSDGWCGFGEDGAASRQMILSECQNLIYSLGHTTLITIIVQGEQAAAYINDQPLLFANGIQYAGNETSLGASISDGTGTIDIDDVELWNLNK